MELTLDYVRKHFPALGEELGQEFVRWGSLMEIPTHTEILQEGQSVKIVPLVVNGLLKVSTRFEEKELLLYYIQPRESCIMSFLAGIRREPSKIFATTEETTTLIAIPAGKLEEWLTQFPRLGHLFFDLYNQRYAELIETLQQLIFQGLDQRLHHYLKEKARIRHTERLDLRHREIALELGTSREVITRVLKKLEKEGKIQQTEGAILLKK
jgi:CRP/FNR family transcriptional regulator